MYEDLYWNGKRLAFTRHFKEELAMLNKFEEFALYILERGIHERISKRQNKYNVLCRHKKKAICLIYAVHEESIIMIHIKPIRRK